MRGPTRTDTYRCWVCGKTSIEQMKKDCSYSENPVDWIVLGIEIKGKDRFNEIVCSQQCAINIIKQKTEK